MKGKERLSGTQKIPLAPSKLDWVYSYSSPRDLVPLLNSYVLTNNLSSTSGISMRACLFALSVPLSPPPLQPLLFWQCLERQHRPQPARFGLQ